MATAHGAILIVPDASDAETILPETRTPSFPRKENSPIAIDGGGERASVDDPVEESHDTLTSRLF